MMIRIMQSEWQRMWARKKTKVLLFGYLGLLLLSCWFLSVFKISFYDPPVDRMKMSSGALLIPAHKYAP